MAALSFHETKNLSCGEGGALLINDPQYIERALILREKGTERTRFFRGEIEQYTWVDIGSSYLLSDILAAILVAQLESRDKIQSKRKQIWEYYFQHLRDWAPEFQAQLPTIPDFCEQSYHLFYLIMSTAEQKQALIQHLKSKGILSVFHYLPLHLSEMGQRYGARKGDCPVTEDISQRLVRLPFYYDLTEEDQAKIVSEIKKFSVCHHG